MRSVLEASLDLIQRFEDFGNDALGRALAGLHSHGYYVQLCPCDDDPLVASNAFLARKRIITVWRNQVNFGPGDRLSAQSAAAFFRKAPQQSRATMKTFRSCVTRSL